MARLTDFHHQQFLDFIWISTVLQNAFDQLLQPHLLINILTSRLLNHLLAIIVMNLLFMHSLPLQNGCSFLNYLNYM
jgi:hypothetical protein